MYTMYLNYVPYVPKLCTMKFPAPPNYIVALAPPHTQQTQLTNVSWYFPFLSLKSFKAIKWLIFTVPGEK